MSKSGQEKMEVVIRSSCEIAFLGMSKNSQKKIEGSALLFAKL